MNLLPRLNRSLNRSPFRPRFRSLKRWLAMPLLGHALALSALALSAGTVPAAQAQTAWPSKPIRVIVPYPAGGNADSATRALGELVSAELG